MLFTKKSVWTKLIAQVLYSSLVTILVIGAVIITGCTSGPVTTTAITSTNPTTTTPAQSTTITTTIQTSTPVMTTNPTGNGQGSGDSQVPGTFIGGEFAGEYNPADIRGSYNFGYVSQLWGIPLVELRTAFGLETIENLANFRCGDLHEVYINLPEYIEIGTGSVKIFVALYTGLPITLLDDDYLPQSAVEMLKAKATLTDDQIAFLDTHSIENDGLMIVEPSIVTEASSERIIIGDTTFKEILDLGVPEEEIKIVIGEELPTTDMTIRDFAIMKGLDTNHIRALLQAKVDALGSN